MILGRPTNLWLGAVTAIFGALAVIANVPDSPLAGLAPYLTASIVGVLTLAIGAVISLVANQTPTVNQGSSVNVVTPAGEANKTVTV